jgi:multidrug efflux pump subunit AcrA (membrane-fusion protein)
MRFLKKLFLISLPFLLLAGLFAYKTKGDFSKESVQAETKSWLQSKAEEKPANNHSETMPNAEKIPFVRTAEVQLAEKNSLALSGILKARNETPLAFQINGRIITRNADEGDHVKKGDTLFQLDSRDIQENIKTAQANINATQANVSSSQASVKTAQANVNSARNDVGSAQARLNTMVSELKRSQNLYKKRVISTQLLEQAQLAERQAREQVNAAKARVSAAISQVNAAKAVVKASMAQVTSAKAQLAQSDNTQGYTSLNSPASGVLVSVVGEIGQVVGAGQRVALLALDGNREIEVAIPDYREPPKTGTMITPQGKRIPLKLRLVSASVDPQSRTWQVRYTVENVNGIDNKDMKLGLDSIVHTEFDEKQATQTLFSIPISALDERAKGAQVWQVIDGYAQPKPVTTVRLTTDNAIIKGDLKLGEPIISLGTHLLTPKMRVQEIVK